MTYYLVQNGAIASGPHDVRSDVVKRLTSCGNPELLGDLSAYGLVPEVRAPLAAGQMHAAPVLAADGLSVTVAAISRPLDDLKTERIAAINADCTARILARWPLEKQISALAGVYGPAELAAMTAWVDDHIAASNVATSAVFDATTQTAMEAVTVAWPV